MQNLFLTGEDQIIDLSNIAAIEVVDEPVKYSQVRYHLMAGTTIVTRYDNREAAVEEKWMAYNQLSSSKRSSNSFSDTPATQAANKN